MYASFQSNFGFYGYQIAVILVLLPCQFSQNNNPNQPFLVSRLKYQLTLAFSFLILGNFAINTGKL